MPEPVQELLQYFEYQHLPEELQRVSMPFCDLANKVANELPNNSQLHYSLSRLLEAKDGAVRAALLR